MEGVVHEVEFGGRVPGNSENGFESFTGVEWKPDL